MKNISFGYSASAELFNCFKSSNNSSNIATALETDKFIYIDSAPTNSSQRIIA